MHCYLLSSLYGLLTILNTFYINPLHNIEINVEFSEDSPIVGDGRIDAVLENNDDRVTRLECTITCGYRDCPTFPVKNCEFH